MNLDYDVAICTAPTDDRWYGVQAEGFGGANAGIGFDSYQPQFGFASRPLDATREADGTPVGCVMFKAETGNAGGFAWLGHDVRFTDKCPPVTQGSSVQWNAKGAFSLLDYETDTWTLYVPREKGTKAHTFVVGQDANGVSYTELRHQNGAYFTQRDQSTVIRHTGNALIEVKSSAINLNGAVNAPTLLAVGGTAAISLALAEPLLAYMSALENVISALAAATTPPTTPAISTALAALGSLKAAISSTAIKGI